MQDPALDSTTGTPPTPPPGPLSLASSLLCLASPGSAQATHGCLSTWFGSRGHTASIPGQPRATHATQLLGGLAGRLVSQISRTMGSHETQRWRSAQSICPSAKELLRAGSRDPLPACTPQGYFITPACSVTVRQLHTTARKFLHPSLRACFTSVISCPQSTLRSPGAESSGALQAPFYFCREIFSAHLYQRGGQDWGGNGMFWPGVA